MTIDQTIGKSLLLVFLTSVLVTVYAQGTVDPAGRPVQSYDLQMPPGVGGLVPRISITYTGGANSSVGWGWKQNLSSISRCGAVLATDTSHRAVQFDQNDKLCLDGKRLIALTNDVTPQPVVGSGITAPSNWPGDAAGVASSSYREYTLESDQQLKVRAYGLADCSNISSGPAYFKVWQKNGDITEYGDNRSDCTGPANALITASYTSAQPIHFAQGWLESRVSDVHGNHVDYKYQQRDVAWGGTTLGGGFGHEWTLNEVQYNDNKVVLRYSDRSSAGVSRDVSQAYQVGSKTISAYLLQSVTTYVNAPSATVGDISGGVAVQTTKFGYDRGPITQHSHLHTIQNCAGEVNSTLCRPSEIFAYNAGGNESYVALQNFTLASAGLFLPPAAYSDPDYFDFHAFGKSGVLTADFNGDGKTDILIWSAVNPSQNQLWLSNGDGTFRLVPNGAGSGQFNITSDKLFSGDGYTQSVVMDFNNDGLPDILSYTAPCIPASICASSILFLNNGDGSFTRVPVQLLASDGSRPVLNVNRQDAQYVAPTRPGQSAGSWWGTGSDFFLVDVNGDGILDVVTTIRPGWPIGNAYSAPPDLCASTVCTQVFLGDGHGNFTETATNVSHNTFFNSAHPHPFGGGAIDNDHDGFPDIFVDDHDSNNVYGMPGGTYTARSKGNGNFDLMTGSWVVDNGQFMYGSAGWDPNGAFQLDFLGSGRPGFMNQIGQAYVEGNISLWGISAPTFGADLRGVGLTGFYNGATGADIDGDGRDDVVSQTGAAYLSNGDGSFSTSSAFNIGALRVYDPNQTSRLLQSYVIGNFTGSGQPEFLVMGATNSLYVKSDPSRADLLTSVTDHNGRKTSYTYVPLSNPVVSASDPLGPRYVSDIATANAATGTQNDRSPPMYVVATVKTDDGVGGTRTEEYSYQGFKVDTAGRDSLGFRVVRRQAPAPNGVAHTSETTFLQTFPYIGMPATQSVYSAVLNQVSSSNLLSRTTNVYCDQTAAAGADDQAVASGVPCTSSAVIRRPYVAWSQATSQDPGGHSLGTQTTRTKVDANLEPLSQITAKTLTNSASDTYTQKVTTTYFADNTVCTDAMTCNWILSRPQTKTTEGIAPTTMLATSAGTASLAMSTQGTGTLPPVYAATLSPVGFGSVVVGGATVTQVATLTNSATGALALTVPAASSVSGTDFSFVSTTCSTALAVGQSCAITVAFKPTAVASRSGSVSVSTSAGPFSANLSGSGVAPSLTLSPASINFPNTQVGSTAISSAITLTNGGGYAASSIVIAPPAGVSVASGGTCGSSLAAGASCTFSLQFAPTSAGTPSGSLTVTAQYATIATMTISGTASNPSGSLSGVSFGSVAFGSSATQNATLSNTGVGPLTITAPSTASVSGTDFSYAANSCAASLAPGAQCNVSVKFAPTAVGARSGQLTVQTGAGALTATLGGTGQGSAATLTSAATLVAPPQAFGTHTENVTATYRNDGNAPMTLASPTLAAPLSVASNSCSSIAAGASCNIVITAGATVAGVSVNQSFVPTGANVAPAAETINWTTQTAIANLTPTTLAFGVVPVGTTAHLNLTLTNGGNTAFNWAAANLSDTVSSVSFDFSACSNVAPNANCTVVASFAPSAIGSVGNSNLSVVQGMGPAGNSITVSGNGGGSIPTRTTAATLSVPAVWYGAAAQTVTATYLNNGNMPMTLATPSLAAPLSVSSNNCSGVAAGSSCSMVVTVATNVPGISQSQTFSPTGGTTASGATTVTWTTQAAVSRWSATSLSFGTVVVGSTATQNITLYNDGNVAYNWASNNGIYNAPAGYSFNTSACSNVAAGGGSCNVVVTFSPTAVGSAYSGSGVTMAAGSYSSNNFSVNGTGGGSKATLTSSATLASPAVWYGAATQQVTASYRNDGNLPMTLASPSLSAPLSVASNSCSGVVAGASCSIVVSIATNMPGIARSQSFTPSGATTVPAATTVTWQTQTAVPFWSPGSLAFGNVTVGTSASQNVTLSNEGNVAYNWAANNGIANAPAGYSFNTSACASVAPGGSCNVVVTFSPSALGTAYPGNNTTTMSAASYSTNYLFVSGTGGGAAATRTSSATLTVPAAWYGASAQSVTATYRNDGNMPMSLASPSLAAPLSVTSNTCSAVSAGSSCSMVITAATNIPGISQNQSFVPGGANVAPAATVVNWTTQTAVPHWSSTALAFGNVEMGSSATQNVTLTNDGNASYNWASNSSVVNAPSGFSLNTSACGNVAPSSSCNVVVTFAPMTHGSSAGGSITMSAASYNTNTFSVSGNGLNPPSVSASPTSYSNSVQSPAAVSTTIAFSNGGEVATTLNFSITGGATVSPSSLSCAAGGACGSVTVTTPAAIGTYSGTLSATSSAGGTVASVPLTMSVTTAPFTMVSSTGYTTTFKNPNSIAITPLASGLTPNWIYASVGSNTCNKSIAAGATCQIVITAGPPDCKADTYTVSSYVTAASGANETTYGSSVTGTTTKTFCSNVVRGLQ